MSKKNICVLTVTLLAVIGVYAYLYRDAFKKPHIQVQVTIRLKPSVLMRKESGEGDDDINVNFGLNRQFKLTSIKVIPVSEAKAGKFAHPLWEMVSDSNSVPTQVFTYGSRVRGMHPANKADKPEHLAANVPYRLIVAAGNVVGDKDFTIGDDNRLAQ